MSGKYDDASVEYVTIADLKDRDVLVFPLAKKIGVGGRGESYDYYECNTVVLSGKVTDKIEAVPMIVYGNRYSSDPIVANCDKSMRTGKPFAGRVNSQKSQYGTPAYAIVPWVADDSSRAIRDLADEWYDKYEESRKAGRITDTSNASGDPFAEA